MDTREKYIKMCEKAEEIQREWKPKCGDIIQTTHWDEKMKREGRDVFTIFEYEGILRFKIEEIFPIDILSDCFLDILQGQDVVWLPRQDELQDMMGIESIPTLLSQFNEFVFKNVSYVSQFIDSLEKTWLAFVMKEKYNKVWDGKEWI